MLVWLPSVRWDVPDANSYTRCLLLLLLLLLLLYHDGSLQPTRDAPPPMDEQPVSGTFCLVCLYAVRVCAL